jgi:hypothetical protein
MTSGAIRLGLGNTLICRVITHTIITLIARCGTIPGRTGSAPSTGTLVTDGTEQAVITSGAIRLGLGNTLICRVITHTIITLIAICRTIPASSSTSTIIATIIYGAEQAVITRICIISILAVFTSALIVCAHIVIIAICIGSTPLFILSLSKR